MIGEQRNLTAFHVLYVLITRLSENLYLFYCSLELAEFRNSKAWQRAALLFGIIFHLRESPGWAIVAAFASLFIIGVRYPQIAGL